MARGLARLRFDRLALAYQRIEHLHALGLRARECAEAREPDLVRRIEDGLRHFLRAETGNWLLAYIRSRLADHIVYQSDFSQRWWERAHGPTRVGSSVLTVGLANPLPGATTVGLSLSPVVHWLATSGDLKVVIRQLLRLHRNDLGAEYQALLRGLFDHPAQRHI